MPILTKLLKEEERGCGVLYVSPLKALINDQYDRMQALCASLDLSACRWHGDVDADKKRRFLQKPAEVLLITPESLEAMFVLRGSQMATVFDHLQFVIIDEMHSFIGSERGRQLQSQMRRLELVLRRKLRRVALSATLGDMGLAAEFLRSGAGDRVMVIESAESGDEILLQIRGYLRPQHREVQPVAPAAPDPDDDSEDLISIGRHIFKHLRGSTNLIFANSRSRTEELADLLRRLCEQARVPNEFFPHHGSLSRDLRHQVEARLKESSWPTSVVCTTTLEMGIDIGQVKAVVQVGPAPSVAALRQRLGRSGRRGDSPILRVYVQEEELSDESPPQDLLRLQLIQSIAQVELLLQHWVEPPKSEELHLSTLAQQVLSLIAQCGGVTASQAWEALCQAGPFSPVTSAQFTELLRQLGRADILMQSNDGTLLLSTTGERIVNHYDFYAAFVSPEEYRLVTEGKPLGSLPVSFPVVEGMPLVFAGRRWRVIDVNPEQKVIDLVPARAGRLPNWTGGGAEVHERVRKMMFDLLASESTPRYLDSVAGRLLREARENFRRMQLGVKRVASIGETTFLFPWMGDPAVNTLVLELVALDFDAHVAAGVISIHGATQQDLSTTLNRLVEIGPLDALELSATVRNKAQQKYDHLLSEPLLCAEHASRSIDVAGAYRAARVLLDGGMVPQGRVPGCGILGSR